MSVDARFFLSTLLRAYAKYWSASRRRAFRRAYALGVTDRRQDRAYAGHEARALWPLALSRKLQLTDPRRVPRWVALRPRSGRTRHMNRTPLAEALEQMLAERSQLDQDIAAVQAILARSGNGKLAGPAARHRRDPAEHHGPSRQPRQAIDWEHGKQLWASGMPVREIAAALKCRDSAIYYQAEAHHWPARKKNGLRPGRKGAPAA